MDEQSKSDSEETNSQMDGPPSPNETDAEDAQSELVGSALIQEPQIRPPRTLSVLSFCHWRFSLHHCSFPQPLRVKNGK